MVTFRIAQSKKAFTVAEELILSCALDMCREIIGEAAALKLQAIPLSNDTIRRIIEMSDDIEQQLLERIKWSPNYVVQMDESANVSNAAFLLAF